MVDPLIAFCSPQTRQRNIENDVKVFAVCCESTNSKYEGKNQNYLVSQNMFIL